MGVPFADNRNGQPERAVGRLDLVPIGKATFLHLDIVEENVNVTLGDFVQVPEPREVSWLMDADDQEAVSSPKSRAR